MWKKTLLTALFAVGCYTQAQALVGPQPTFSSEIEESFRDHGFSSPKAPYEAGMRDVIVKYNKPKYLTKTELTQLTSDTNRLYLDGHQFKERINDCRHGIGYNHEPDTKMIYCTVTLAAR